MNFKANKLSINLLPKYNDIVNCIIYYKENAIKDKIKNVLFIKKSGLLNTDIGPNKSRV